MAVIEGGRDGPEEGTADRVDIAAGRRAPEERRLEQERRGLRRDRRSISRPGQPLDEEARHLGLEAGAVGHFVQAVSGTLAAGPELVTTGTTNPVAGQAKALTADRRPSQVNCSRPRTNATGVGRLQEWVLPGAASAGGTLGIVGMCVQFRQVVGLVGFGLGTQNRPPVSTSDVPSVPH